MSNNHDSKMVHEREFAVVRLKDTQTERWVIVRTQASQQRAQLTLQRQASRAQARWEQKRWHLSNRRFAWEADARAALERELKGKPTWLEVHSGFVAHPRPAGKGRPRKDATPSTHQWQIVATVTVNQPRVDEEVLRKACFIVGLLGPLYEQIYKASA